MQTIIIGNFGNHSLAVMQALIEREQSELHFMHVDTGWASASWLEHVTNCIDYARSQGVVVHSLKSQVGFVGMVRDRQQFPSPKFQWCASFLKALPILSQLDDLDPSCEAMIVSGKRRADSRRYIDLEEFETDEEVYQGRTLWYPLWQASNNELVNLIKRAGFQPLRQQSQECGACIHLKPEHLGRLDPEVVKRVEDLETDIGQFMFLKPMVEIIEAFDGSPIVSADSGLNLYDLGCGAPWGCGE